MTRLPTEQLQRLSRTLEAIGSREFEHELGVRTGRAVLALIDEEFERESDPYRRKWKPLATRKGRILQKTGTMRSSFAFDPDTPDGFSLWNWTAYFKFHQYGTQRIPQRMMVPIAVMPDEWGRALNEAAQETMDHVMAQAA